MEKITLPDGKVLSISDDITSENRRILAERVRQQYDGFDINQTTVLGRAAEIPKAIARGASGLAIDAPLGIAALFDVGDDGKIVKGLQGFKKRIREESPIAASPGYEDLWTTKLGEGLGSFVPFLGAGIAGRALTKTPKPFFSKGYFKTPEFTLPTALAVPTGVAQQADRVQQAREMGEDVGGVSETVAELLGGAIGITEVLPIGALLARTSKTALKDYALRDKIKSALIQGTQEGAQEVFASLAQDLTARGLYSDELPIGESLLDEFTIGGVIGAGADLVVNSFAGRRGIGNENLKQREGQLRQNRIQLQDEKRFDKAVDQGLVEEIQPVETKEKPDIPIPVGEIQPLPNFEIIQDTQGNFNLIDTTKEGSPVLKTFSGEAEAITAKEKELNKLRVKNLKIDIENDLYNQGLINSATGFDLGVILKDPNSIEINPQSIINFDSRVKKADRKEIEAYFKNKNIELKPTFTMQEVRQILSPKDLKNFQSDLAQQIFRQSEKRGEPSIRDDKNQVNVNNKYIKELAESKNIELDFKDPAVQYFTRQVTGYDDLTKVKNRGAKELFVARLHSLPKFNFKTKLPDFRPREYTAEDMANFVANAGANDIQFSVKDLLQAGPTAGNKNATEQFIRDLTTSGRANKVEGTNKYKINKNYEFEVARKAEGFNETPEEFGERLTREGVLPPETIEQLVAAEQLRQEKYLPPKEVAPKMINFAQSIEEGRLNKFAREARKILDKAGLKETGVVISDDILSTTTLVQTPQGVIKRDPRKTEGVKGEYDRNSDIVFVSLNAVNPDGLATDIEIQQRINGIIDHELVHALRKKDLINEKEYQYLRQEVKRRKVPESVDAQAFSKNKTYYERSIDINKKTVEQFGLKEDRAEELYVEEAIAELYRNRFSKPDIPKKAETIFEKIAQFFKSIGQALRRSGFDKSSDIFRAIEEGEVGTRKRGEIRTLQMLDELPLSDELQPIVEIDETRETGVDEVKQDSKEGNISTIVQTSNNSYYRDLKPSAVKGILLRGKIGTSVEDVDTLYDIRKLSEEEKQADKELILKEFAGKDSIEVAEWLSKNGPSKDYKMIADRIYKQLKKFKDKTGFNFTFDFYTGAGDARPGYDRRYLGRKKRSLLGVSMYPQPEYDNGKTFRIYINNTETNGVDFNTILHELVHASTQAGTTFAKYKGRTSFDKTNLIKGTEKLERIRSKLVKEIRKKKRNGENVDFYIDYGTKNIDELLAVGFTDREFQQFMESIEYAPKQKTLWESFVDAIRQILGLPAKAGTVFSEFLKEGSRYLQLTTQEIKQIAEYFSRYQTALEPLSTPVAAVRRPQEAPTFSRQSIDNQINQLNDRIFILERRLQADGPYLPNSTVIKEQNQIGRLKAKVAQLEQERRDLPPEQPPLFSRAATDTQPPYMDFNRQQIKDFSSNRVGFYGEEIPLTHVARMQVNDFLKLTTTSQNEINEIIEEGPLFDGMRQEGTVFDPEIADTSVTGALPSLQIKGNGQVVNHEGRHRVALIGQGGGRTVPVFIYFPEGNIEQNIPNPSGQTLQEQGVTFLKNQYQELVRDKYGDFVSNKFVDFVVPLNKLGPIAPLHRDSAQTEEKLDYAVEVANQPDTLASSENIPLFSRAARGAKPAYFDVEEVLKESEDFNEYVDRLDAGMATPVSFEYARTKEFTYGERKSEGIDTFPRVFISRMPIKDFLTLTTPITDRSYNIEIQDEITGNIIRQKPLDFIKELQDDLKKQGGDDVTFDPQLIAETGDTPVMMPMLLLDETGKVLGHDGRMRSMAAFRSGASEAPVFIAVQKGEQLNYKKIEDTFAKNNLTFKVSDIIGSNILTPQTYRTPNRDLTRKDKIRLNENKVEPLFHSMFFNGDREKQKRFNNRNMRKVNPPSRVAPISERFEPYDGDIPSFSRAATDTSPAYMDLNANQINAFFEEDINTRTTDNYNNKFVMRMPVDDFLKLTTPNDATINKVIEEGPTIAGLDTERNPLATFDPSIADETFYKDYFPSGRFNEYVNAPLLYVNTNGRVTGHNGRHRAALLKKAGGTNIPVLLDVRPDDNRGLMDVFDNKFTIEDYQINNLLPQDFDEQGIRKNYQYNLQNSKVTPFKIKDISGSGDFELVNLQELLNTAQAPDIQAQDVPLFSRSTRYATDSSSSKNKKLIKATERVEEIVKSTPNGEIPTVNPNASDIAFESFLEFNDVNNTQAAPDDIPSFSIGAIPDDFRDVEDKIGYIEPTKSFGARIIDFTADPIESIKDSFKFVRTQLIDKLDLVDKKIVQAIADNEEVRLANNTADTATMAALRMADRARGLFQGMLTRGFVTDTIDGEAALANVNDLDISTVYNPYIEGDTGTGGLMQIIAPLYADPTVNREFLFKAYATAKRTKTLTADGKQIETPLSRNEALETIRNIEQNYPSVVEVYNNYQNWNNKLITFAENKGLLNPEQAALWRAHSSYYPFYRKMVDDDLSAPSIGGGSLPNNPLSIKITGSDNPLDVDPIEAIARNSLSILTAALKNDGTSKLLRDLSSIGEAVLMTNPQEIKRARLNRIFTFENGEKVFYKVLDPELFYGLQSVGGMQTDFLTKIVAAPASLLRDTVTRDPGFVIVNVLRDTLSSAVTSGAPITGADGFTPVIDSFKNLFGDMKDLEKFGVLGGYDFQNDEGSVKQFIDRTMRKEGLQPNNSTNAKDMFFKLWDGLGALTTKSDGATRKAVYDSVYKKLIKEGYTEAQAQSEAAFQALEIINFGRRGLSPMFRTITAAIPFLNARIQGLDVLFRAGFGKYSAVDKIQEGETRNEVRNRIIRRAFTRGGFLMALTALYYMMVSDDEEYQNLRREVRDDNWIIPLPDGIPALKIPIPFEVGMLFKTFPERFIDEFMGREIEPEFGTSIKRQLGTSAKVPFFDAGLGFQLLKPFAEVYQNRNTFTNTEIVPYYQQKLERGLQARPSSNELLRVIGETFNISPAKLEHVLRGYTGTLGGYVLDIADVTARAVTGTPLIPPDLNSVPVLRRLLIDLDRSGGGLQQQFYELRGEVDTVVQTMNKLRENERFDEYSAYRSNMQGVLNIKGQVRSIERYLDNYRKRRDRLLKRTDISALAKSELLKQMELERDRRLAIVPELRDRANIPVMRGV